MLSHCEAQCYVEAGYRAFTTLFSSEKYHIKLSVCSAQRGCTHSALVCSVRTSVKCINLSFIGTDWKRKSCSDAPALFNLYILGTNQNRGCFTGTSVGVVLQVLFHLNENNNK